MKTKLLIAAALILAVASLTNAMETTDSTPRNTMGLHQLPKDVRTPIFDKLLLKEIATMNTVCKDWQDMFVELDLSGRFKGAHKDNDDVQILTFLMDILPTFPKLKKLTMVDIKCRGSHTLMLMDELLKMDQLESLNLSNNSIGDGFGNCWANYLKKTTQLNTLILKNIGLNDLEFGKIVECLITMKNVINGNQSITHLDCSHNPIGDGGAISLCRLVAHNQTLKILNFSECGIEDFGLEEIGVGLLFNDTLTEIILAKNKFTPEGVGDHRKNIKDSYEYDEKTGITKRKI